MDAINFKSRQYGRRREYIRFMADLLDRGFNVLVPGIDDPKSIIDDLSEIDIQAIAEITGRRPLGATSIEYTGYIFTKARKTTPQG